MAATRAHTTGEQLDSQEKILSVRAAVTPSMKAPHQSEGFPATEQARHPGADVRKELQIQAEEENLTMFSSLYIIHGGSPRPVRLASMIATRSAPKFRGIEGCALGDAYSSAWPARGVNKAEFSVHAELQLPWTEVLPEQGESTMWRSCPGMRPCPAGSRH